MGALLCLGCWREQTQMQGFGTFSLAAIIAQAVELAVLLSEAHFWKPTEAPVLDKDLGDHGLTLV